MTPIFSQAPQSLCILRLSAIGDICHTLAVVRAIQQHWPTTRLTWVIGKLEASLIGDIPDIEFVIYNKADKKNSLADLQKQLSGRQFDALLHMQISWRSSQLARHIKSPIKLGYDKARAKDWQWLFTNHRIAFKPAQHVMDALFGFAESIGVPRPNDTDLRWDIPLSANDIAFAEQHIPSETPALIISPCSSQRARNFRNWPVDRYQEVVHHAIERHQMQVVVTGGPTDLEAEYARQITKASHGSATNLCGQTSLKQLLALLSRASAVLTPDSGPAHMATTVGTPVIGLYASSNPARTGPYLSHKQWVVNAYPEACLKYLNKTADQVKWGQRVRHPAAMELIQVRQVTDKLDALFEANKAA